MRTAKIGNHSDDAQYFSLPPLLTVVSMETITVSGAWDARRRTSRISFISGHDVVERLYNGTSINEIRLLWSLFAPRRLCC
jgi:hypothetical protein